MNALESSPRRHRLIATAAMIGSAACWGGATVMSRDLLYQFQSSSLLVIQLAASVVALMLLAARHRPWRYVTASLGKVSLTGILEPGLAYSIGLWGLSLTSAGSASIIGSSEPIFIIVLAWMLSGGLPSRRLLSCVLAAMAGLLLVSWDALTAGGTSTLGGNLLIVLGTVFAAAYVVLSARFATQFPAAILAGGQQLIGLACAVALFLTVKAAGAPATHGPQVAWSLILYAAASGVVQYALAFWLYLLGLRYFSASAASLWLALIPVFGVGGAYFWLHEIPTAPMLLGTVLIIGAVYMGRMER